MNAQLLTRLDKIENHPLTYTTVPDPKPAPDQVLIKIKACGVCYSNLSMIEGEFKPIFGIPTKLPIIPGHEITGIIQETGNRTSEFKRGDRVGVQVLWQTDGTCEFCRTGRENICINRQTTGETVDGGYAEYLTAPSSFVYRLPENLVFEESAPLFCPGITAYHAVKRAKVQFGQKVAVIGIGGVGHMSLQFAKLAGAETIAVDTSEDKLKLAKDIGADHALTVMEVEDFAAKTGKPDVVMVHAPSQKAVDQALRLVKRGGTVLLSVLGYARIFFPEEHAIIGSVIGTRQDMDETLRLASKGKVKVDWKAYKLSQAEEVLVKLKQGRIVGRAILVP
ncbi:MAG: alcohol dehydrogenase catalytic domain-containing protein [Candidatus Bathyarchaeota archaeon]|nr:alcohol dehydrogenase catalytic domain-containing protein [Candidatus Bathyarchaeota archaeon]